MRNIAPKFHIHCHIYVLLPFNTSIFKIPSVQKNINNELEDQFIIMQASDDKLASEFTKMNSDTKKRDYEFNYMRYDMNKNKTMLTNMMSHKHNYSPYNTDKPKAQDPSTAVPFNKNIPQLEVENYTKLM